MKLLWLRFTTFVKRKAICRNLLYVLFVLSALLSTAYADDNDVVRCTTPPVSTITAPATGTVIGNGATIAVIQGTAASSSSRVVKVKVSVDGGRSWSLATDTSGDHTWRTWSYRWKLIKQDEDGDINIVKDGTYTILSRAKDAPGCVEGSSTKVAVTIDNTAPVTSATADGYAFGTVTPANSVSVALSAVDRGSGIAPGFPKYCIDTTNTCTPALSETAPVQVTCMPGSTCGQYVRYLSADNAGNTEPVQSRLVSQQVPDTEAPKTTASASGYSFGTWTNAASVSVTISASDSGSGVAPGFPRYCVDVTNTCSPDVAYSDLIPVTCSSGSTCIQYVRYRSIDNSGNAGPVESSVVQQDLQAPAITPNPAPGTFGTPQTVTLTCNDGTGSGCSKIYYTNDATLAPGTGSWSLYTGPVTVSKSSVFRTYAQDSVSNNSAAMSASYVISNTVTATAGPNGSIVCIPTVVEYGQSSICTVTPGIGYHVNDVTINQSSVGPVTSYTIASVTANMTVSASFAINTYTVTAGSVPNGTLSCNPALVEYNGTSSCSITPDTGYHIKDVTAGPASGPFESAGVVSAYTFTSVTSDMALGAVFAPDLFTITINAGPNGSVSCDPATVEYNSGTTCFVKPDAGFHAAVSGCNGTYSDGTYRISNVKADCTLSAAFTNSAPSVPVIDPASIARETASLTPTLAVLPAIDPDGDAVQYTFEIYSDDSLANLVTSATTTDASWTSPSLSDNTLYTWRVQATDGWLNSAWTPPAHFFVNTTNDAPLAPGISWPSNNMHVSSLTPALTVMNGTDVDIYDQLSYDFEVAIDGGFTSIVASATGVPQSTQASTSWTVSPALAEDTPYYWRARTVDNNGAASAWVSASFFVNTKNDPPSTPTLNEPANASEVSTLTPWLTVNNAVDPDQQTPAYFFELDTVMSFDSANRQASGPVAEGSGTSSWLPAALTENTTYYWRAKASDGLAESTWMPVGSFFVNTVNEAPTVPTLNNPAQNSWVTVLTPALQVNASTDPDRDSLTYEFEVYADSALTSLVTSISGASTSWIVDRPLTDNTWYWWRAQARDEHGAAGGWMSAASFFVNNKGYDDPPKIAITSPSASEAPTKAMSYTIAWSASDPDSNPAISLFYDVTGSGYSGTQIATGMRMSDSSSFTWDISSLANGTYYIYATIDDGTTVVSTYAPGPLVINRTPPLIISAAADTGGSISPSGQVVVTKGDTVTFTITSDPNYQIRSVIVDGANRGTVTTFTFTNVTANHTINAYFKMITYSIVTSAGTGGTVSPLGTNIVNIGSNLTCAITPKAGYHIDDVLVDGVSVGAVTSYTFTAVSANHTVGATFALNPPVVISASAGPNGTISPSGDVAIPGGASQKFTMTPAAGYRVADILVDGQSAGAVATYTFTNVQIPHTIVATFTLDVYTVTAQADVNGSITPSGPVVLNRGDGATFTITPDDGYDVRNVLVDGVNKGAVLTYTFSNVTANHTINAYFKVKTYTITASAGTGGSISPGTVSVTKGATQIYTITPAPGYHIADVLVDGLSAGPVGTYAFTNVAADHTIAASFGPNPTYTITAIAGPNGVISPSGAVSALGGTTVTFTMTPAAGYRVADVVVDGVSSGPVTSYTFSSVSADHTIAVTFTVIQLYSITATAGPNGSISPAGTITVAELTSQTFTMTPAAGYRVLDVLVDGTSVGARTSYTFSSINANHTITASFTPDVYIVTAAADLNGAITPSGNVAVNNGGSITFTITPDPGYDIRSVIVDGANRGAVSSFTFTNVTANHTINAYFKVITYSIVSSAGSGGKISPLGTAILNIGMSQTYTITPLAGYHIADVLVDGTSIGAVSTYTFSSVSANHTIAASFDPNPSFTITAPDDLQVTELNGTISPAGITTVLGGTDMKFTITPDAGYRIADVLVDGVSQGAIPAYTFKSIWADHTIAAVFTPDVYVITASAGLNGIISPSGSVSVNNGDTVTFTITPDAGYSVSSVIVDGLNKGAITSFTFTSVTANHSISANFN